MTMPEEPSIDVGFDEEEALTDDDVVTLRTEGGEELSCVVLAVVDHDGASYAVLTEQGASDEADLLVTRYAEDEDGVASFSPVEDGAALGALREALADLLDLDDTPVAEA